VYLEEHEHLVRIVDAAPHVLPFKTRLAVGVGVRIEHALPLS